MLRVAVIGVGSMGKNHARIFAELAETDLVGIADMNEELAKYTARRQGTTAYRDYRHLLDELRPDAVSVAVPTALHEEVASAAMRHGAHVLIEKPIADTVDAARRLVNLAHDLDRKLMVGHIVRFNPAIQKLKQLLNAGELGRVFQITCRRTGPFPARIRDVGVVIDLAPHDLDIMRYLLGSDPISIFASTERRIHTEHEDLMVSILRFPNGTIGQLEINWLTPTKVREIRVLGDHGMYLVNDLTQDLYFYENGQANGKLWNGLETIKGVSEGQMVRYAIRREEPLKLELTAFVDTLLSDGRVPVDGEDGIAALRASLAIVESGRNHCKVVLQGESGFVKPEPTPATV
jgi:UDP-N-acetylglucosamine 3-dehydrogenase